MPNLRIAWGWYQSIRLDVLSRMVHSSRHEKIWLCCPKSFPKFPQAHMFLKVNVCLTSSGRTIFRDAWASIMSCLSFDSPIDDTIPLRILRRIEWYHQGIENLNFSVQSCSHNVLGQDMVLKVDVGPEYLRHENFQRCLSKVMPQLQIAWGCYHSIQESEMNPSVSSSIHG